MEYWSFNFYCAPSFQERTGQGHHFASYLEDVSSVRRHPQVDVPLPITRVGVTNSVPFVGERSTGFGQTSPRVDANAEFTATGRHHNPRYANPITQV